MRGGGSSGQNKPRFTLPPALAVTENTEGMMTGGRETIIVGAMTGPTDAADQALASKLTHIVLPQLGKNGGKMGMMETIKVHDARGLKGPAYKSYRGGGGRGRRGRRRGGELSMIGTATDKENDGSRR